MAAEAYSEMGGSPRGGGEEEDFSDADEHGTSLNFITVFIKVLVLTLPVSTFSFVP